MGTKQKGMDVFMLLDRTGSMAGLWEEAVSSVNAYVKEMGKDGADDRVSLAVFDAYETGMQFNVLRNAVPIADWKELATDEVLPRGMTPLLDALVRIITRAEEVNNEKTVIVVMTDGYENASREITLQAAKAAIERVTERGWQVNFLGADFDGIAQARGLGVAQGRSINFKRGHAEDAMTSTADIHRVYRNLSSQVDYREQDRRNAREEDVN
jgi:Mg-chelatase subunit ChlD